MSCILCRALELVSYFRAHPIPLEQLTFRAKVNRVEMPNIIDEPIVVKVQCFKLLVGHIGSPFFRVIRLTGSMALVLRCIFFVAVFVDFHDG